MKTITAFFLIIICLTTTELTGQNSINSLMGKGKHYVTIDTKTKPKYSKNFTHFKYTNPNSPKYGKIFLAALDTFNSLNPFIDKGSPADNMALIYDSLMVPSLDEENVSYTRLAEKIYYDDKRTWTAFKIHPQARWHDGKPVTADDLIWTFNTLVEKGTPFYRYYYQDIKKVTKLTTHIVKFDFKKANQEMPYILGQIYVLPKHYWEKNSFYKTDLTPPLGSGPYKIGKIVPGSQIVFERIKNYWGKNIPVNAGTYNFDAISYEYYRDQNIIREALKGGKIDFFSENTAKEWANSYDIKPVKKGQLIKALIPHKNPQGLQALIFNTRKKIFQNPQVRWAIIHAFDFEWLNKNFFFGSYIRSSSYFNNSEMAANKLPDKKELKILNRFKGKLPPEVFTKIYAPPKNDGSGNARKNLRLAQQILSREGWKVKDQVLTHEKTGEKMKFTILVNSSQFENILIPFTRNLKVLGIQANIQVLNPSQFENKIRNFDYDMLQGGFGQSSSPGNEQYDFWGSKAADKPDSRNFTGIKDPIIDSLIDLVVKAQTQEDLIARVRSLDRALIWAHYVIPQWYYPYYRILYWNKFSIPKIRPQYGFKLETWSIDKNLEKKLK